MDYEKIANTIMKRVMPQSFPLGVKLLKPDEAMPEGATRPGRFDIKIALCQWTTVARRWGWTAGAMAEDISCTPCLAGFGFKRVQDRADIEAFFMEMGYFDSPELAKGFAARMRLIDPGEVAGVVAFPLEKAPAEPDLFMIYGNPAQMARLASGYIHSFGTPIQTETGFGLSCLSAVLPFFTDAPTFVHPGRGERILAGTEDSEMIFAMPAKFLEGLADGLEKSHKKGTRYPVQKFMLYPPPMLPAMKALDGKLV